MKIYKNLDLSATVERANSGLGCNWGCGNNWGGCGNMGCWNPCMMWCFPTCNCNDWWNNCCPTCGQCNCNNWWNNCCPTCGQCNCNDWGNNCCPTCGQCDCNNWWNNCCPTCGQCDCNNWWNNWCPVCGCNPCICGNSGIMPGSDTKAAGASGRGPGCDCGCGAMPASESRSAGGCACGGDCGCNNIMPGREPRQAGGCACGGDCDCGDMMSPRESRSGSGFGRDSRRWNKCRFCDCRECCWDDCFDAQGRCKKCFNYCGIGSANDAVLDILCNQQAPCRCRSESLCDRPLSELCGVSPFRTGGR